MNQPIVVGDTINFTINAYKDGVPWDLIGGTVVLYLVNPNKIIGPLNATISNPTNGVANFQCSTSTINTNGLWKRQWIITDRFGTVMLSDFIQFDVQARLNA